METKRFRKFLRLSSLVPAFFALFLAVLFLSEFVSIGIIARPETIAGYDFGSEGMIGAGGWRYRSAQVYALSALAEGILLLSGAGLLLAGVIRRKSAALIAGYILLAASLVLCFSGIIGARM